MNDDNSKHAPWALPMQAGWPDRIEEFIGERIAAGQPITSLATYRTALGHLARRAGSPPETIAGGELVEYAQSQAWSVETRRGRRQIFLNFFAWMIRAEHRADNPALRLPKVKTLPPTARPAPDAIYQAALLRAQPRERLMLRLSAELGMRRAEVACVHSADLVDDGIGYNLRIHGKGMRERELPLPDSLAREIAEHGRGYLFPGGDGGHLSPRWVGKIIAELIPGEDWTMHALRHRFGTRAYAATKDLLAVQELLGHSNPNTTKRYIQSDRQRLRGIIDDLAG